MTASAWSDRRVL